jgi:hypothetical protein
MVRNILALVGGAVVTFAGLGWYLGWYSVARKAASPGQSSFQVDINREQLTKDIKQGIERGREGLNQLREGSDEHAKPSAKPDPRDLGPQMPASAKPLPSSLLEPNPLADRLPFLDNRPAPAGPIRPVGGPANPSGWSPTQR